MKVLHTKPELQTTAKSLRVSTHNKTDFAVFGDMRGDHSVTGLHLVMSDPAVLAIWENDNKIMIARV
jgi:hypothetical protein